MIKDYDVNDVNKLWAELLDQKLFTFDELQLITNESGYSIDALDGAVVLRYAFEDLDQMSEEKKKTVKECFKRFIK